MKDVSCVFLEVSVASIAHDGTLPINLLIIVFLPLLHASLVLPGITCQDNYRSLSQHASGRTQTKASFTSSPLTCGEVLQHKCSNLHRLGGELWAEGGVICHSLIFPFGLFHASSHCTILCALCRQSLQMTALVLLQKSPNMAVLVLGLQLYSGARSLYYILLIKL